MNECICCGTPIPYSDRFCPSCAKSIGSGTTGQHTNTAPQPMSKYDGYYTADDAKKMRELLRIERMEHAKTRRKLEKADHDRKRYAKRIRLLDGRHNIICAEYRAVKKENDILKTALAACERSLLCQPDPPTKTQTADSISPSANISLHGNCSESSAHSTNTQSSLSGASEKYPEAGAI